MDGKPLDSVRMVESQPIGWGGFSFWLANYEDMLFNEEANEVCAEFLRRKIRETIRDPVIAEKLTEDPTPTAPNSAHQRKCPSERNQHDRAILTRFPLTFRSTTEFSRSRKLVYGRATNLLVFVWVA